MKRKLIFPKEVEWRGYTPLDLNATVRQFYLKSAEQTPHHIKNVCVLGGWTDPINLNTEMASLYQKKERNLITYTQQLLNKWGDKQHLFSEFNLFFLIEKWKRALTFFLSLTPTEITFDLTDDVSIFFRVKVKTYVIYYELYFDNDIPDKVEAIINVYEQGKVLFGFGGTMLEVEQKLLNALKAREYNIFEPTLSIYGVPKPTAAIEITFDDYGRQDATEFFPSEAYRYAEQ